MSTTLVVLQGGRSDFALQWEADLERAIAETITRYTMDRPCPAPSVVADDLIEWARLLHLDADTRILEVS
jgi:hypothetical protein